MTLFTTGKLRARHKTFWTLSPPIPQFKVLKGKFPIHTFWFRLNPATLNAQLALFNPQLVKKEQYLRCNPSQFCLENLEGIVVIVMILELIT